MPISRHVWLVFVLAIVVTGADQLTKWLAEKHLSSGEYISIFGDFLGLTLVYNPGASFGMASGLTWLLTLISIGVTVVIIRFSRHITSTPWAITLGAFLGGSIGNLIDRIFREPGIGRGHVVDFIAYNDWFVGNVADIALVLGAIALMVLVLANKPMVAEAAPEEAAEGAPSSQMVPPQDEPSS